MDVGLNFDGYPAYFRHRGGINILFVDHHVEFHSYSPRPNYVWTQFPFWGYFNGIAY